MTTAFAAPAATHHRHAPPSSSPHDHAVQFYDDDAFLGDAVAQFLVDGLDLGEPAVLIATPEHRDLFLDRLRATFDVDGAVASGQLALLDARETLSRFLVDGAPDWSRFRLVVEGVMATCRRGRDGRLRAYGEMVDLLWRDGNQQGAIALEEMWNELGKLSEFSLLCAYVMDNFVKHADGEAFASICRAHSVVVPTEAYARLDSASAREREVSVLQQRARALEHEIAHRQELEHELRVALRARREAEAALTDFFDNAVLPLHSVGPDGVILWANQAELDLVGYAASEYVGRSITEFHADAAAIADILVRLAAGETLHEREARIRCKDGAIKTVLVSSNVAWQAGNFVRTRCFTRDVTAQRQAEEARRRCDEELVTSLGREKAAREEAERTVRYNELFAGILGHDLRNPLNAITAGAHYLVRMNAGEKVSRTAGRILSSTDRMARMVDQLLDFTRIRVGQGLGLRREPMDVAELCRRVKEELEAAHPNRDIDVFCDGDATGAWDADRLLQVFSNLVGNALTHSREGRVALHVTATPADVRVSIHNRGEVPSDVLPVIFEPFRGSQNKQHGSKGLGLGLYITQQIVTAHGGVIDVASSAPVGTTFSVTLPRGAPVRSMSE